MRHAAATVVLAIAATTTGCGSGSDDAQQTLNVYAASSLTGAFQELAEEFEAEHDGVEVELTFGGSSQLAAQIDQGAPADVFASADQPTMDELVDAGLAARPQVFATNIVQVAVPPDNPAGITDVRDLARPGVRLVVCAPEVPCGAAAQQLAAAVGLELAPVSEEQAVTDVLGKVRTGEADAGLVYVTDVIAAGDDVRGVAVPEAAGVVNTYPIAPVVDSDQVGLAEKFVRLVTGATGRDVLAGHGFGKP